MPLPLYISSTEETTVVKPSNPSGMGFVVLPLGQA